MNKIVKVSSQYFDVVVKDLKNSVSDPSYFDKLHILIESDNSAINLFLVAKAKIFSGEIDEAKKLIDAADTYKTCIEGDKVYFECENAKFYIPAYHYFNAKAMIYGCLPEMRDEAFSNFKLMHTHDVISDSLSYHGNLTLYSFRRFNEFTLSDLINNTITVVSPKCMNDPFDSLLYDWLRVKDKGMSNLYGTALKDNPKMQQIYGAQKLYTEAAKYYRIRSFCIEKAGKNPVSNTLMWSHYADSHKGICVCYELSQYFICHRDDNGYNSLNGVTYTDNKVNLKDIPELDGHVAFFTKSKDWQYENEFRLLTYRHNEEGDFLSIPLDSDSSIKSIYFGVNCTNCTKNTLLNLLKGKDISFYNMGRNDTDLYNLSSHIINE